MLAETTNSPGLLPVSSHDENKNGDSAPGSTNTTPFIKRKCLNKDEQFTQTTYRKNSLNTNLGSNSSPYLISSINLTNEASLNEQSPKQALNDSFETLQMMDTNEKSCSSSTSSTISAKSGRNGRYLARRLSGNAKLFSKHKSAPLSNLTYSLLMNQQQIQQQDLNKNGALCENQSHPLNDISNHINSMTNSIGAAKMSEDMSFSDEQRDDVTDLENLIFGTASTNAGTKMMLTNSSNTSSEMAMNAANYEHQSLIKQSLDIDATHKNLIGDRTKQHILPIIQSNKHHDLHCISPETVRNALTSLFFDIGIECRLYPK